MKFIKFILLLPLMITQLNCQELSKKEENPKIKELYMKYLPDAEQWFEQYGKNLKPEQLVMIATAINYSLEFAVIQFQKANAKIAEKLKDTFAGLKNNIETSPEFKSALDQMGIKLAPVIKQIDDANSELFGRTFAYYKKINDIEKDLKFPPPPIIKVETPSKQGKSSKAETASKKTVKEEKSKASKNSSEKKEKPSSKNESKKA